MRNLQTYLDKAVVLWYIEGEIGRAPDGARRGLMTTEQIVILVLSIVLAAALVCAVVLYVRYRAEQKKNAAGSRYADEVIVKDGVRYSADPSVERGGAVNVSHAEGDFVLAAGKTYRAQKDGELLPGTYTLLASNDAAHTFKLRVGGLVRTFSHGDTVVLKDGEEICAVSGSVILR